MSDGDGDVGRNVGGLVGGTLGAYFGGPQGAYMGFSIGYSIGSIIDPLAPERDDPSKMSALRLQGSSFGVSIPDVFSSGRIAGNIIFVNDFKRTVVEKEVGAKDSRRITSKDVYSVGLIAIGLCAGTKQAVARVWAGNKLVFDRFPDGPPSVGSANAFRSLAATVASSRNIGDFRFHSGSETQEPDSGILSILGVDDCPAYRGLCYVVIEDLQLGIFGDRLPSFQFEVVEGVGSSSNFVSAHTWVNPRASNTDTANFSQRPAGVLNGPEITTQLPNMAWGNTQLFKSEDRTTLLAIYAENPNNPSISRLRIREWASGEVTSDTPVSATGGVNGLYTSLHHIDYTIRPEDSVLAANLITLPVKYAVVSTERASFISSETELLTLRREEFVGTFLLLTNAPNNALDIHVVKRTRAQYANGAIVGYTAGLLGANIPNAIGYAIRQRTVFMLHSTGSGTLGIDWVTTLGVIGINSTDDFVPTGITLSSPTLDGSGYGNQIVPSSQFLFTLREGRYVARYIAQNLSLFGAEIDILNVTNEYQLQLGNMLPGWSPFGVEAHEILVSDDFIGGLEEQIIFLDHALGKGCVFDFQKQAILAEFDIPIANQSGSSLRPRSTLGNAVLYVTQFEDAGGSLYKSNLGVYIKGYTPGTTLVSEAINRVMANSPLTSSQFDTQDLVSLELAGYTRSKRGSVRAVLTPLMTAFQFDAVERDFAIHFRRRNKPPVAYIPLDDLAATEFNESGRSGSLISLTRRQEIDLPKTVYLKYLRSSLHNDIGSTYATRRVSNLLGSVSVSLPLILSQAEAENLADVILYSHWAERMGFDISVGRKWDWLNPGDSVLVDTVYGELSLRITEKEYGNPGVVNLRGVTEVLQAYEPITEPELTVGDPRFLEAIGPTCSVILDMPPLDEEEYQSGAYVAACGLLQDWANAAVSRSVDGSRTNSQAAAVSRPTVIATLQRPLRGGSIQVKDTVNSILIKSVSDNPFLMAELLLSRPRSDVLDGANRVIIIDPVLPDYFEIIGFETVTVLPDGTRELSDLWRGMSGTSSGVLYHKQIGSWCVLMTSELGARLLSYIPAVSAAEASGVYRVVSDLDALTDPFESTFHLSTDQSARPPPPANVVFDPGNGRVTWTRVNRFPTPWVDDDVVIPDESIDGWLIDVAATSDTTPRASYQVSAKDDNFYYSKIQRTLDFPEEGTPAPLFTDRQPYVFTVYAVAGGLTGRGARASYLNESRPNRGAPWNTLESENVGTTAVSLAQDTPVFANPATGVPDNMSYNSTATALRSLSLPPGTSGVRTGVNTRKFISITPTDNVRSEEPFPPRGEYTSFASAAGDNDVAVGKSLTAAVRTFGLWTEYQLPRFSSIGTEDIDLLYVGYDPKENQFVATGECAYIAVSPTGLPGTWTQLNTPGLPPLLRVRSIQSDPNFTQTALYGYDVASDRNRVFYYPQNIVPGSSWEDISPDAFYAPGVGQLGGMGLTIAAGGAPEARVIVAARGEVGSPGSVQVPRLYVGTLRTNTFLTPIAQPLTGLTGATYDKVTAHAASSLATAYGRDAETGQMIYSYSTDSGQSWSHVSHLTLAGSSLPDGGVNPLILETQTPQLVGISPIIGGIYHTSTDGATWSPLELT